MKKFYLVAAFAGITMGATAQISDGSFEAGAGGGDWTEQSDNFGTPLCDAGCGTCGGPCVANTGAWYAWFGGAGGAVETGYIEQSCTIPNGATGALRMFVKMPEPGPGIAADKLVVKIDGTTVGTITALDSAAYKDQYALFEIAIDSYTDGASHTIRIEGYQSTTATVNILVDDVVLFINGATTGLFEFETGENEVIIFPNPASESINLQFRNIEGDVNVAIYDLAGNMVSNETVYAAYAKSYKFETANLENGTYLVTVSQNGSVVRSENIVISK
ncbi:MAG: T9SS type A sorting domain-containing protein [Crocinitomicaceae bacterium]|nr:T9SS type A sorting domain-containing protein [Crocinitomicaceae bacterium]